jgi:hypothetical protein
LFLFLFGRPQPNCSVVPGPETNFLFPRGVSYWVAPLGKLFFFSGSSRIQLQSGVKTGN